MHVLIFAGGTINFSKLIRQALAKADIIIAADGGANTAVAQKIMPDVVVGDFDSIAHKTRKILEKKRVLFVPFQKEKDETDTELAIDYAIKQNATEITIVGGNMGDRFDHVMANILLAAVSPIPITFVHGNQMTWIEKGPANRSITGTKGDLLSLIPLIGSVEGVTLSGLQYPLTNETLLFGKPRGVSNVFLTKKATIRFTKGILLITRTCLEA